MRAQLTPWQPQTPVPQRFTAAAPSRALLTGAVALTLSLPSVEASCFSYGLAWPHSVLDRLADVAAWSGTASRRRSIERAVCNLSTRSAAHVPPNSTLPPRCWHATRADHIRSDLAPSYSPIRASCPSLAIRPVRRTTPLCLPGDIFRVISPFAWQALHGAVAAVCPGISLSRSEKPQPAVWPARGRLQRCGDGSEA